jgi:hypothetical protein
MLSEGLIVNSYLCGIISESHLFKYRQTNFFCQESFLGGECLKKKIIGFATLLAFSMLLSVPLALAVVVDNPGRGPPSHVNDGTVGIIYVTSDGTNWYTIVPYAGGTLVYNGHNGGSFQQLFTTGPNAPYTNFGPGDPGYRGGRWWVDDGDGVMEPEGVDHYFLCPLTHKAPGT